MTSMYDGQEIPVGSGQFIRAALDAVGPLTGGYEPFVSERSEARPDCDDAWHFAQDQPADPCPACGDVA